MIDNGTLECWRTNYDLHLDPHELADFWRGYTPTGAVLALKSAVEEIERLRAALVESAGEVDRLGYQLAEARELLAEVDVPADMPESRTFPYGAQSWVRRRDALLERSE